MKYVVFCRMTQLLLTMAKATEPFIFESWASENELPVKIIYVLNKEDINSEKILLGLTKTLKELDLVWFAEQLAGPDVCHYM